MNRSVRKISDGAMMTAVLGVLLLLNRVSAGFLEGFMIYLYPLPMLFYSAKYGGRAAGMVYVAMVLLAFILSTPSSLVIAAGQVFIGLVYGNGVYRQVSNTKLLLRTVVLSVISAVLQMIVFAKFFGYDNEADIAEMEEMFNHLMQNSGGSVPSGIDMHGMLVRIAGFAVVLTGVLDGVVVHLAAKLLLKRLHMKAPPSVPLRNIFPPCWSGYVAIAAFVGYYVSAYGYIQNEILNGIVQGAGMISIFYLGFFGMCAMTLLLETRGHMKRGGAAAVSFLFMMFLSLASVILGFFYIVSDFHKQLLKGDDENAA